MAWRRCLTNVQRVLEVHSKQNNHGMFKALFPRSPFLGTIHYCMFPCYRVCIQHMRTMSQYKSSAQTDINDLCWRSHTCGELRSDDVGQHVVLCGWVQYRRIGGKFVVLRDAYGTTQLMIPAEANSAVEQLKSIPLESVVCVGGVVQNRLSGEENPNMSTGDVEVVAEEIILINKANTKLPFTITDYNKAKESTRLRYRYLDFRFQQLQRNLRLRSQVIMKMRDRLVEHGFVDVETPTLFKRTPGGAHEFIVPTQFPGEFYSLVQSPQQLKQLLMVGGLDRYFQVARCYRDESGRPDRQPEFTQLDLEMSFVSQYDIMKLVEDVIARSWPEPIRQPPPFPKMTFRDVMTQYGTDKPDLRIKNKLQNITEELRGCEIGVLEEPLRDPKGCAVGLVVNDEQRVLSLSVLKKLEKRIKVLHSVAGITAYRCDGLSDGVLKHAPRGWKQEFREKLRLSEEQILMFAVGPEDNVLAAMGRLRQEVADVLESKGVQVRNPSEFNFLWVIDFPMFVVGDEGELECAHHPFTQPHPQDVHLLRTKPLKVRSQQYDLVLNGQEVGGGSIRIHDSALQRFVLEEILGQDTSSLGHLLEALDFGCPPHGGIALGLDRLISILCRADSIRDVIAFPKTSGGRDLMAEAPSKISRPEYLRYYIETHY